MDEHQNLLDARSTRTNRAVTNVAYVSDIRLQMLCQYSMTKDLLLSNKPVCSKPVCISLKKFLVLSRYYETATQIKKISSD